MITEQKTYQMKLLKPRTKMAIPVNWITSVRLESNASISCGNIGANDNGPNPWLNETAVAQVSVESFQNLFQFYCIQKFSLSTLLSGQHESRLTNGSWGSLDGCGTSTRSEVEEDLIK